MASIGAQFNIGSDTKITILVNGSPLIAQIMTKFEAKQRTTALNSKAIDGVNRNRELPEGWDIDMEWDRGSSAIDDFVASEEANRYAGLPPSDIGILETTNNPDGSVSRYRYTNCTIKLDTAGERSGDSKVTQKATLTATRRIPA
jgi:hypothetical protein